MRSWLSLFLIMLASSAFAHQDSVIGFWCPNDGSGGGLDLSEDEIQYVERTYCESSNPVQPTKIFEADLTCANYLSAEHRATGNGALQHSFSITARLGDDGLLYVSYVGMDVSGRNYEDEIYERCNIYK